MARGISINGCSGSGKTTIGRKVAERLGYLHLDLDDYYWDWDAPLPYTQLRPKDEVIELLQRDMAEHDRFVMSGSISSKLWDFVNPLLDFAVLLSAPPAVCMERVKARAFSNYGDRVLEGGDLYESHQTFYKTVGMYHTGENPSYSLERHQRWARELACPVLHIDGTRAVDENVEMIVAQYLRRNLDV